MNTAPAAAERNTKIAAGQKTRRSNKFLLTEKAKNRKEKNNMGFGTLFIGYFFLINISYFSYTDIISGMVMLLALYKLSGINKSFAHGMTCAAVFSCFALFEIILAAVDMFSPITWLTSITSYISAVRYIFIFILTFFILHGINEVSREVEADALAKGAKASLPLSLVFLVAALFEMPFISGIFGVAVTYVYFAVLLAVVMFIISNLMTIYKAYMQICMPEELNRAPKKSKFEFMNRFYDSIEKKSREYAEYKLSKNNSGGKEKNKNGKRK